jgi:SAM-dependent methyltransferase
MMGTEMVPTEPQPHGGPHAYIPLPCGLANPREAARAVFDRFAEAYDAARPGYPAAAITDLLDRCHLDGDRQVLEIGCGTGQATRDLAPRVGGIRCLELGENLAARARANLRGFPHVEVVVGSFEEEEGVEAYDAVVAATSFHWVDPSIGFPQAARLLRPSGTLALLTTLHVSGGTEDRLAAEFHELHARLFPDVGSWTFPTVADIETAAGGGGDLAEVWARLERTFQAPRPVAHLFEPPEVSTYPWIASYDTSTYQAMLSSQLTYALMEPPARAELLGAMGRLVDAELGGVVTKQYVAVLATARRADRSG